MSITSAPGFLAAGVHCGIKPKGLDLALVVTADAKAVSTAAVFTTNLAAAAPVQVSRSHLAETCGRAAAVVINSGNANAATGVEGRDHAEKTCALVASELGCPPEEVLVCSTGLIGIPLDFAAIESGVKNLVASRASEAGATAASAIMTTDTVMKQSLVHGNGFVVGAMAKGAAMLAPHMATMLAFITTDARVEPEVLQRALKSAVGQSFNQLSVDGCTSTNDTVMAFANGQGSAASEAEMIEALTDVCTDLAEQMANDAEGHTKVVRVHVVGAEDDEQAERAARKVAESQLVKCSFNGSDPYWGRVISELGTARVAFDIDKVVIDYGGIIVCQNGTATVPDVAKLTEVVTSPQFDVTCDLRLGTGTATVLTNDLSHAYIDENAGTS